MTVHLGRVVVASNGIHSEQDVRPTGSSIAAQHRFMPRPGAGLGLNYDSRRDQRMHYIGRRITEPGRTVNRHECDILATVTVLPEKILEDSDTDLVLFSCRQSCWGPMRRARSRRPTQQTLYRTRGDQGEYEDDYERQNAVQWFAAEKPSADISHASDSAPAVHPRSTVVYSRIRFHEILLRSAGLAAPRHRTGSRPSRPQSAPMHADRLPLIRPISGFYSNNRYGGNHVR